MPSTTASAALLLAAAASQAGSTSPTHPLLDADSFSSLHLAAWRIEPPVQAPEVLLEPTFPWEADVHSEGTILVDPFDRQYKAYYVSAPATYPSGGQTFGRMLTIATSSDGRNWSRPMLPLVPYGNATHTNILLRLATPSAELSQISVFANPGAEGLGRYDMFLLASEVPQCFVQARSEGKLSIPEACSDGTAHCTYRFASSDGLRWEPREVRDPGGDSDGSFVYRERDGSFVAYIKASTASPPGGLAPYDVGAGGQRMIVVSRSDRNGSVWQRPYYCTQPDWRDAQGDQFVGMCKIVILSRFACCPSR